jgi:thymidylate kinase
MPFIAFLGCDGSGKSAVIQGVAARLEAEGYPVTLGHWRPKPFASSTGSSAAADDPHGKAPRGFVSSILKLGWLWLNWWAAWILHLRKEAHTGFVLYDRYHGDLLVDPIRYRYGGPMWLAKLVSRMMPQPDLVLFLDASPEILISRKQEVPFEQLVASRGAYQKLKKQGFPITVVDASQSLSQVRDAVWCLIQARD